ncbi:MAG: hypothetical protein SGILL_003992 [Bacillariaceae sp.]
MVQETNGNGQDLLGPSAERRQKLKAADANSGSIPTVSNFFPLERYWDASDKVFQSFQSSYENRHLNEAYVYGMRYSKFCMEGITTHDYYRSNKFTSRRMEMGKRTLDVVDKLEIVKKWMDAEEEEKEARRKALLKKQKEERLRKQREIDTQRIDELQKRMAKQKSTSSGSVSSQSLAESALAKLQRLGQPQGIAQPLQLPDQNKKVKWNLPVEPDGQLLSQLSADAGDLPPPLLPPQEHDSAGSHMSNGNSPPSYNSILKQSSYFGPGRGTPENVQPVAPSYDQVAKISKKKPKPPPIRQLISGTRAKHRELLSQGKIKVSGLGTYQGRVSGSTNGCTVISACCVSKHMQSHAGITNDQIVTVIDRECVPLLRAIRNKLELGGASLIIPSDVHDYMVDRKLLHQHKFVGATGGNIIDPSHYGQLLTLLQGEPGKTSHLKAGATLFFREHVVSIVKIPTGPNTALYDMIDSLPTYEGRGSRTRCQSLEALKVHLSFYCTKKLSDSNVTYIERNKWDDGMADFDPRVFQAFVWADLPQPSSN